MEAGALIGAEAAAESGGVEVFDDELAWDVLEDIPNDSAAALLLIEHHWAVPLRDAIFQAGGFRLSDGFISPLDLIEIGLVTAEEAAELHAIERGDAAKSALSVSSFGQLVRRQGGHEMMGSRRVARRTSRRVGRRR